MALYIVVKENKYFPKATFLDRDEDGFQRCRMKRADNGGWLKGESYGAIVPAVSDLLDAVAEVRPGGGLDQQVLNRLVNH